MDQDRDTLGGIGSTSDVRWTTTLRGPVKPWRARWCASCPCARARRRASRGPAARTRAAASRSAGRGSPTSRRARRRARGRSRAQAMPAAEYSQSLPVELNPSGPLFHVERDDVEALSRVAQQIAHVAQVDARAGHPTAGARSDRPSEPRFHSTISGTSSATTTRDPGPVAASAAASVKPIPRPPIRTEAASARASISQGNLPSASSEPCPARGHQLAAPGDGDAELVPVLVQLQDVVAAGYRGDVQGGFGASRCEGSGCRSGCRGTCRDASRVPGRVSAPAFAASTRIPRSTRRHESTIGRCPRGGQPPSAALARGPRNTPTAPAGTRDCSTRGPPVRANRGSKARTRR